MIELLTSREDFGWIGWLSLIGLAIDIAAAITWW